MWSLITQIVIYFAIIYELFFLRINATLYSPVGRQETVTPLTLNYRTLLSTKPCIFRFLKDFLSFKKLISNWRYRHLCLYKRRSPGNGYLHAKRLETTSQFPVSLSTFWPKFPRFKFWFEIYLGIFLLSYITKFETSVISLYHLANFLPHF